MSPSNATISWTPPGGRSRSCTFTDECSVGRALTNRVILDGDAISRKQALFQLVSRKLQVLNLSRSCPIILNETRQVAPTGKADLVLGDRLDIGPYTFEVTSLSVQVRTLHCSNPTCSRDVPDDLVDCPWCGRSLAFAQTQYP